ncbi:hypothetical protein P3S68_014701 [Capsicum galapagoense]
MIALSSPLMRNCFLKDFDFQCQQPLVCCHVNWIGALFPFQAISHTFLACYTDHRTKERGRFISQLTRTEKKMGHHHHHHHREGASPCYDPFLGPGMLLLPLFVSSLCVLYVYECIIWHLSLLTSECFRGFSMKI